MFRNASAKQRVRFTVHLSPRPLFPVFVPHQHLGLNLSNLRWQPECTYHLSSHHATKWRNLATYREQSALQQTVTSTCVTYVHGRPCWQNVLQQAFGFPCCLTSWPSKRIQQEQWQHPMLIQSMAFQTLVFRAAIKANRAISCC